MEPRILGDIDNAHAAGAGGADDAIVRDRGANYWVVQDAADYAKSKDAVNLKGLKELEWGIKTNIE